MIKVTMLKLIPMSLFKGNDINSNKYNALGKRVKGVENISLPLLFNNNTESEKTTFGTPKEIKTTLLSTFAKKDPIKTSENILEVKNHDNHDESNSVIHDESNSVNRDESNSVNHDESNSVNHDESNSVNHDDSNNVNHDESNSVIHDESNSVNHDESNSVNHDESNSVNHDDSDIDNYDDSDIDNYDVVNIPRNYHILKEENAELQTNIQDILKSRVYTEKRNQELQGKLNDYRSSNNNINKIEDKNINKTEDEKIEKRYNLNSSDFSIIKNKIENKEISKKEKVLIMKKYLQANDIFMKKVGFIEKIKNIFGKSEKIYWIKREQATDALNILNKFIENSKNINKK
ncbi:hypothetical protein [Proteus faecis]|uniref:hypothetical protein n=1 Tax=Proteus faecis TaxID=2050967 RepID=UPI0021BB1A39|nr:hypothetical protein [Proteus faecis]MCT8248483.1 hypothetical protein [Proteus faecis]